MPLETVDMIDRALDAAEARIMDSSESSDTQVPLSQDPKAIEETREIKALEESKEKSESKELKSSKTRDTDGKFTKTRKYDAVGKPIKEASPTDINDQAVSVETQNLGTEPQAQSTKSLDAPTFWSAEQKALWAKVPSDVQAVIAQRELNAQQQVSRLTTENQTAKTFHARLYSDFETPQAAETHKAELALNGIKDPIDELHRYRAWDKVFKTNIVTGIKSLMQKNNLSVDQLLQDGSNQYQPPLDPRIEQALASADEAKRLANEQKDYFSKLQTDAVNSELKTFRDGKDSYGNVRDKFVGMYEPQITGVFTQILQQYPHLTKQQALDHAYEFTMQEVRNVMGVTTQPSGVKQVASTQAPTIPNKALKAKTSVSGSPSNGTSATRPKAKTIDEALDRAEEALYGVQ